MKKVLYVLASALFLLGAASCEKKSTNSDGQSEEQAGKVKVTFAASSQQGGTKTSLSATDQVLWSEDDEVTIYAGDEEEVFTIESGVGTTSGTFEGWATTGFKAPYYAIYPATAAEGISGDNILFTIPASQTYTVNSFGNGSAIMAAYSAKDKSLAFKNLVGIIDLKLTGTGTVKSLTLMSATKNICGTFSVSKTEPTAAISATAGAKSIALSGASAITLSGNVTHVYVAIAPDTYAANDLSLYITNSNDEIFHTNLAAVTVSRAGIKEVPVAVEFVTDPCTGTIPTYAETVTDVCGNTYKTVVMGTQTWMAENMRCNKYSANSDADASLKGAYTIPPANQVQDDYTPYTGLSNYSGEGNPGYFYNWAAAVGVTTGYNTTITETKNRQGICPDGWHVPSNSEFNTLRTYIQNNKGISGTQVGHYLSHTTGWAQPGQLDCYGFTALPTDWFYNKAWQSYGGLFAYYWTINTRSGYNSYALHWYINTQHYFDSANGKTKNYGLNVRCLKN